MTITITGASGFVGQHLFRHLAEQGHDVHSLSLREVDWDGKMDDRFGVSGGAVVHLAGKAHDTANTSAPEEYFQINRDITIELFDLFLKSEARDFVYFSSVKAVADTVDGILTEDVTGSPQTPYGQSKWEAEQYILQKTSLLVTDQKRVFIIRPCMIHGPGNKGNLNLLYKVVQKGVPWPLTNFDNTRSFLSISNLLIVIRRVLEDKSIPGGIYNLADDESLSTNEIICMIAKSRGQKPRLWQLPKGLIRTGAKIGDLLHLPLTSERLKKLTENYVVSNQKIKTALGIEKLPMSAKEGMMETLRSFK